ncbi:hypothetical protein F4775DRAFT_589818 [Biscogniauxia sp. FL1348]|nr:hypothetical protein F4775DRAFT_589818 [Biscogniauxia sp. FL1348]
MDQILSRNQLADQGLTQVHTGLAILLGTGHLKADAHGQILAFIIDKLPNGFPGPDEAILLPAVTRPMTAPSTSLQGVESGIGRLSLTQAEPGPHVTAELPGENNSSGGLEVAIVQRAGNGNNLICPWWATDGYECRDFRNGNCPFIHQNTPGAIKQPLICSFYADGNRCRKSADNCRFAHYRAEHRQIAPTPTTLSRRKHH